MIKIKLLFSTIIICTLISCEKSEVACIPPSSDPLYIEIQDSLGNNLLEQNHPDLTLTLADSLSSHLVNSADIIDGTTSIKVWDFYIDEMISGYNYVLEYDSIDIDTISVDWVLETGECDGNEYFYRSITSVQYNDSTFTKGGLHTVIKAN